MEELNRVIQNIKNIDQTAILIKVLNKKAVMDFLIFLNTENQLAFGLDSEGRPLGFYRDPFYADLKKQAGGKAPLGHYDFKVTGEYFKTWVITVLSSGVIEINSNTIKPDRDLRDLVTHPDDIEGLMDRNFDSFIDFIQPIYINELESEIYK